MEKVKNVFKVGDKVRVKSREELERAKTKVKLINITKDMLSLAGLEGEVTKILQGHCFISIDGNSNIWKEEWLEPIEETSMCYFKGVPGRGEDIKRELLNMGGCIRTVFPEYTYEDANFYYFIDPTDNLINGVEINSLTGRILKSTWSEKILPQEEETREPEKEEKYIIIHEGRCMRRVAHGRKEAEYFKRWILKDKPYAKVELYKIISEEV